MTLNRTLSQSQPEVRSGKSWVSCSDRSEVQGTSRAICLEACLLSPRWILHGATGGVDVSTKTKPYRVVLTFAETVELKRTKTDVEAANEIEVGLRLADRTVLALLF